MAQELRTLLPPDTTLLINDRADVAQLAGAAGVHLGGRDLPPRAARSLLGPEKIIGFSTHTESEVAEAAGWPVDYIAFGPIFPTQSKAEAEAAVGRESLRRARARTTKPLVAIGGITPANAAEVLAAGADSVAVIGAWLQAPDIPARLEEFRQAVGQLE
jgi:thiamine-phosphate pyrophosphorylase